MIGIEQAQARVGMPLGESHCVFRRNNGVVPALKDQHRLRDIGIGFVLAGIFHQLVAEFHVASFTVVKHVQRVTALPLLHGALTQRLRPARGEGKRRG